MLSCFVWSRLWLMVTPLYRGHVLADRAWSLCPIIRFILSIQKQKQQQEHTLESNPCSSTLCSRSCQIFFGDATHAVPWAVPFSTGFLLYSVQAIPSNFLSSMRPFWKSNMLNGKCQGYCTCTYIYIYTCTYIYIHVLIYIFLTWQCLQSLHLYFLICSRANYHDPHFMTNFTFLGIPGVCWCSSCLHQSHHAVQSHMVKLPWGWWGWLTLRDFGMYRIQQSTNSNICFEHVVKYVE